MTLYQQQIRAGALSGFASALVVDLRAYSQAPDGEAYNWKKAVARWISGTVTGAMAAAGLSAMTG